MVVLSRWHLDNMFFLMFGLNLLGEYAALECQTSLF